jgi:hypothetical protein
MANPEQRPWLEHEAVSGAHEEGVEHLSEKELAKLLWLSFKFSQGNSTIQRAIFQYLHQKHPAWRVDASTMAKVVRKLDRPATQYIGRESVTHYPHGSSRYGAPTAEKEATGELDRQLEIFQKCLARDFEDDRFEDDRSSDPTVILTGLAVGIIDKDTKFGNGMRPRKHEIDERGGTYSPDKDAYLSHLVWYGLLGNPTGSTEYDKMFIDVIAHLRERDGVFDISGIKDLVSVTDSGLMQRIDDGASREKDWDSGIVRLEGDIDAIVEKWNERHPDFVVEGWRTSSEKGEAEKEA